MKNFKQDGKTLPFVMAADVVSGDGVVVNGMFGVAQFDALTGEECELAVCGVFELPRDAADTFAAGDKVYWNAANSEVTTVLADGVYCGWAIASAAPGSGSIDVSLLGFPA